MNNNGCLGYVQRILQRMINDGSIDLKIARQVLDNVNFEFDFITENEAEQYYMNHSLSEKKCD